MAQTLREYLETLDQRNLVWPEVPVSTPLPAVPTLVPLPGIRAVMCSVYGTLLTISDGKLLHLHPEAVRNQIALEKTIEEFNMWHSMTRKPGQPWEYFLHQYEQMVRLYEMAGVKRKGDLPHVDSTRIWERLIQRLQKKEYNWDRNLFGSEEQYAEKVAYFFHANLQGVRAASNAGETLLRLRQNGMTIGLLADSQSFTVPQLLKVLGLPDKLPTGEPLISPLLLTESHRIGVRKPSLTLYEWAVRRAHQCGFEPHEVLHVSHRLTDDLSIASEYGFRTCLYVGDRNSCRVTGEQLKNPDLRPDRMITNLSQVLDLVSR